MLTQARLKELVSYDATTGEFTRLVGKGAGKPAGTKNKYREYVYLRVDGKRYMAHRVAWLYVYGTWPTNDLDHINQVKYDNRISNLREVTKSENQHNVKKYKSNTSGVTGVYLSPVGKWVAQVTQFGVVNYLGSYDTIEEATVARMHANKKLNFTELHGN